MLGAMRWLLAAALGLVVLGFALLPADQGETPSVQAAPIYRTAANAKSAAKGRLFAHHRRGRRARHEQV